MSTKTLNHINARLSLRPPQADSLAVLKQALDAAPDMLKKERDVAQILAVLQGEFPHLKDFERDFPSLCFALATGVGKTRLMGAFIAYLHLAHGIHNFFVLAPNLTIYDKLIKDFTPNTPKYVFKGIEALAVNPPLVITGDNYEQAGAAVEHHSLILGGEVRVNIFNISKINSEVRGGREPRIKRMREVLGDSYFNHLSQLPDLVLLMDESHRYRALAGMRAINELNPLLGLELTATPFTESAKAPIPFKNVVVDYPLARAMADGFVKMPTVVTQRNFNAANYTPAELEKIKLEDGVRLHERTKVELQTYAREKGVPTVKPFMLIIARDTTHAAQLLKLLESADFYGGRYAGKVIQVDSSRTGKDEEEMIARLLAVESVDEPTEIVIHVNMLKEGWDVTNLYTIVPLRAANARTLIEQSIGRGLRLPYGKRTGNEAVDRLNIVAHDRFQEIIDEANKGDSVLKLQQLILEPAGEDSGVVSVTVPSVLDKIIGLGTDSGGSGKLPEETLPETPAAGGQKTVDYGSVFRNGNELRVARVVMEEIKKYSTKPQEVPTSRDLLKPEIQQKIAEKVQAAVQPVQGELLPEEIPDVVQMVEKTTQLWVDKTIDIPRIIVLPIDEVRSGYDEFTLDISRLHLQPGKRKMILHNLHTNTQSEEDVERQATESIPENYIVRALVDFDDIDYNDNKQREVLYALAKQATAHLRSYLDEEETQTVLQENGRLIAREIHAQMQAHYWEKTSGYEVKISEGFSNLKECSYTAAAGDKVHDVRETVADKSRIKQMLFGGFKKCLYPYQKFDSDTERRFAVILEREAQKWFKPAAMQFQIYYQENTGEAEYRPDFVAETADCILMAETKARTDLGSKEVQAKAAAAVEWCRHAGEYSTQHGGKPWKYLLIPHDEVADSKKLADFLRFEQRP